MVWNGERVCVSTRKSRPNCNVSQRQTNEPDRGGWHKGKPTGQLGLGIASGRHVFATSESFILFVVDPERINGVQWTPARYVEMAEVAFARGERLALVGECQAPDIVEDVHEITPEAVNLCGHASLVEIVFLAWAATSAIRTDNGLMHLIAAAGCHSIVLYDPGSDAALSGHRGPDVTILRRHHLASITAAEVVQALKNKTNS